MHSKKIQRKRYVPVLAVVVVVVVGLASLELAGVTDVYKRSSVTQTVNTEKEVNYDPPTDEERRAGDDKKQAIVDERENTTTPPRTAQVIITDAGQYNDTIEVRSFISNIYQDGTCTITLRQGGQVVTKETKAYRDASTTICANPLFKRSEFSTAGEWQVVVSYSSADAVGQSAAQTVTIK